MIILCCCFLRVTQVIEAAERDGAFEQLVSYLRMARVEVKEAIIENELIYSLAKTNALGDLEELIAAPNVANIEVRNELLSLLSSTTLQLFVLICKVDMWIVSDSRARDIGRPCRLSILIGILGKSVPC